MTRRYVKMQVAIADLGAHLANAAPDHGPYNYPDAAPGATGVDLSARLGAAYASVPRF